MQEDQNVETIEAAYYRLSKDLDTLFKEGRKAVRIDDSDLAEQKREQPSLFFFWSELATYAANIQRRMAAITENVLAQRKSYIRKFLVNKGERVTDASIKALAEDDKVYKAQLAIEHDATEIMEHFKNVRDALYQRRDMLKELTRDQWTEWKDTGPEDVAREELSFTDLQAIRQQSRQERANASKQT